MFGYVRAFKPEMKVKEYETYKAVYCSLCRELGRSYGILSRFTLSYDFVFLALIQSGVSGECAGFKKGRCAFNPLKRCANVTGCSKELSFAAGCAMIMLYYKLLDNIKDGNIFKKFGCTLIRPLVARARKKAAKKYPEIDEISCNVNARQSEIEKQSDVSIDLAAEPTASGLAEILKYAAPNESKDDFYRLGYCVGKWVYFADALDDYNRDLKGKNFNPFLLKEFKDRNEIEKYALGQMNFCICEACETFEKLNFKKFRPILENIIYIGLPNTQEQIAARGKEK